MRDITERLARRLRDRLDPGERVLAGVSLNAKGTMSASISGAARASTGVPSVAPDGELADVRRDHADLGVTGVRFHLLLTDRRVVLVRRNAFGLAREVTFAAPLAEVDSIQVSTRSTAVPLRLVDGRVLELETPKAPRFLPPVYADLPSRLAAARAAQA